MVHLLPQGPTARCSRSDRYAPLPFPHEQARAEAAEEAAAARAKDLAAVKAELAQASLAIEELTSSSPANSPAKAGGAVAKWQASYVARALETSETALDEAHREKVRAPAWHDGYMTVT